MTNNNNNNNNKRGTRTGTLHIDKRIARLLDDHISDGPDDEMLTTRQVAEWIGYSVPWLEIRRGRDDGPLFARLGTRLIRYRRDDVRAWLRRRLYQSTAEYSRKPRKP